MSDIQSHSKSSVQTLRVAEGSLQGLWFKVSDPPPTRILSVGVKVRSSTAVRHSHDFEAFPQIYFIRLDLMYGWKLNLLTDSLTVPCFHK